MKKNILVPLMGAVVLGLGAYVGYHTYDAYAETNESDMLLANVEALANGEINSGINRKNEIDCYSEWVGEGEPDADHTIYKCSPCGEEVKCRQGLKPGKCIP